MSPKKDAYEVVTARIIEALEKGIVPWHKPWKNVHADGAPRSLASGKRYRGINVWTLSVTALLEGYSSPYWLTFKQAKERGGTVRKGEHGTQIVLWKPIRKTVEENGKREDRKFLLMRYFTVFNADQCDGLSIPEPEVLPEHDPIETAESIARGYVEVEVKHGGDRACYSPGLDYVAMPQMRQFVSAEAYYGTLFHELAHSTGHESRLARPSLISPSPFGSPDYSKEELVAEMASAFLAAEAGIEPNFQQHAGYIESWLRALKNDRKLLVQAAAAAQKASDYVLGIKSEKEEPIPAPLGQPTRRKHARVHLRVADRVRPSRRSPGTEADCRVPGRRLRACARSRSAAADGRRRGALGLGCLRGLPRLKDRALVRPPRERG